MGSHHAPPPTVPSRCQNICTRRTLSSAGKYFFFSFFFYHTTIDSVDSCVACVTDPCFFLRLLLLLLSRLESRKILSTELEGHSSEERANATVVVLSLSSCLPRFSGDARTTTTAATTSAPPPTTTFFFRARELKAQNLQVLLLLLLLLLLLNGAYARNRENEKSPERALRLETSSTFRQPWSLVSFTIKFQCQLLDRKKGYTLYR